MVCGISIKTNGNRNLEAHRHGGPLAFLLQQSPSYVKKCFNSKNQERTKQYRENPHQFIRARFSSYRNRAKTENCMFDLTPEYLIERWDTQQGYCFYTAHPIDFKFVSQSGKHPHNWTPSLDRLNPNLGYIKGNIVWCAYALNRMKNDFNYEEFVSMCAHVVSTREKCT